MVEINTSSAGQAAITTHLIDGVTAGIALRFSGSATSTGYVANSNDGSLITFTGHNSILTAVNANTILPRAVGTYNAAGNFTLATTYTGASGQQTRAATSLNNTVWFIADQNGAYANGTTTASPAGNFRSVKSFGGTVYISSASGTVTVIQVSTISAATGGTVTGLPGLANNASLQDFYMVSSGTNGTAYDILYVLSATSNTAGTINKYSLVSGSWVTNGSYTTTFGGFGLAAQTGGAGAYLYVTTGQGALTANSVIKLEDAAGFNTTLNINTASNVILYTAAAGKIIKGIAFAPIAAVSPTVNPSTNNISFANTLVGANTAGQTITLTASNLTPATGTLNITAPNSNFQVSNDGNSWSNATTVAYSSNGTVIGNFQVRFSPQASGVQSGNVSITGGGVPTAVNVAVSGTGDNALSLTFNNTITTLHPPYVTTTINDAADPVQQQGIITDIKENGVNIPLANYTLSGASSNTTVVPNANINITKADGQATIKITAAAVGYADITLTLTKGLDTKTLVINMAASMAASSATSIRWHTGNSDASAAIALDDNFMTISDDEKNIFFVFDRNNPGLPVKSFDFNQANVLGLPDGREVDVEAAVQSNTVTGRTYWLGSMSNSSTSFADRPSRNRLFAINITGTGSGTTFSNAGHYSNLRQQLITWGDANGYGFTASAANGHDPKLIDGFNVEGMVFGPDNSTMYIGFRAPLVPVASRTKAVIAPVLNFETWFNNGAPSGNPSIGAPIELDLGTRGIRDMIRLSNGTYIILAGSYDEALNPAVYRWTGNAVDAPVALSSFNVAGLNIEGVMQVNESGQLALNKLQFISDDGDNIYYGDGIAAKDLSQDNFKKFRSDLIVSPGAVLPVQFEYFTAGRQNNDALLRWKTGNFDNVSSFEILRSNNAIDFIPVATVTAAQGLSAYTFTDKNIPGNKLYYRIKAKEITGNEYLSDTRLINMLNTNNLVTIYPNPVKNDHFSITTYAAGIKTVNIYASNGSLFTAFRFTDVKKEISTAAWPAGTYLVKITDSEGTITTQKLLVQ